MLPNLGRLFHSLLLGSPGAIVHILIYLIGIPCCTPGFFNFTIAVRFYIGGDEDAYKSKGLQTWQKKPH